jgi:ribonuclease G
LAEWLYEAGIGENRAIRLVDGAIVEALIELPGPRAGAILPVRLTQIQIPSRRGLATTADGSELLVEPLPAGLTEGAAFHAEILREPIPEAGRPKLAKARATDRPPADGPSLAARLGNPTPQPGVGPDRFEEAGWSELLDQAATGAIPFEGGALRMSVTPAMILFDVDGGLPPAALAVAGAAAAARAILRFGITGSIGIDLPTVAGRAERQAAATAVDAILPQPFERSAVNGFGFLQIVRRRERPSIPELVQGDPVGAAARALLRQAGRAQGAIALHAHPRLAAALEAKPDWLAALARQIGGAVALQPEPGLAISAAYVRILQA